VGYNLREAWRGRGLVERWRWCDDGTGRVGLLVGRLPRLCFAGVEEVEGEVLLKLVWVVVPWCWRMFLDLVEWGCIYPLMQDRRSHLGSRWITVFTAQAHSRI